jgi:hypothetical protein
VVVGHVLGVNPFDQPDVEAAKIMARQMAAAYQKEGRLPESQPVLVSGGMQVYGDVQATTLEDAWDNFLRQAESGAYVALQAYLPPTEANEDMLQKLQDNLHKRTRLAVTRGYGPRFLHSTGQLHKGDAGKGLFVQLTCDHDEDAPIPDEAGSEGSSMSFGVLELAQALGDYEALWKRGRKVIRFHIGKAGLRGIFP